MKGQPGLQAPIAGETVSIKFESLSDVDEVVGFIVQIPNAELSLKKVVGIVETLSGPVSEVRYVPLFISLVLCNAFTNLLS